MQIHISRDGQSYGPYTPAQITEMLRNGEVALSDSFWIQSTEWENVSTLAEILTPRSELSGGEPVSAPRSGATDRLTKPISSGAAGGFSSSQTTIHRIRRGVENESQGMENLMKGAIGL